MLSTITSITIVLITINFTLNVSSKIGTRLTDECKFDKFINSEFQIASFLGLWYPLMKSKSFTYVSACHHILLDKKASQFTANIYERDNKPLFNFKLKTTNKSNQFSFSIMGTDNDFIINSDNKKFLIVFICTNFIFSKKSHFLVLTRDRIIFKDNAIIKQANKFISEKMGQNIKLEYIDKSNCGL